MVFTIPDSDLDNIISEVALENRQQGAKLMQGYLESIQVKEPRYRVRDSMRRVNPQGVENSVTLRRNRRFLRKTEERYTLKVPEMQHFNENIEAHSPVKNTTKVTAG